MYPTYGILWRVALFAIGIWWSVEVYRRLQDDIALVRDAHIEGVRKGVIIATWAATVAIIVAMLLVIWGIVAHFIYSLSHPAAG